MKHLFSILLVLAFSISLNAQKDVTRFMGIPVDGTKAEMARKLKVKGFTQLKKGDDNILIGEFNGKKSAISIATNNNRVHRILVSEIQGRDESNIKINFNSLCKQFMDNPKYVWFENNTIPEDERTFHITCLSLIKDTKLHFINFLKN